MIPALGHDDGVWTTALEATCETQGEQHKNCTRCGQLSESARIDALGHTPGPEMTCVTDQVCLVCEEVLVPADGKSHVWTEWETYKEAKKIFTKLGFKDNILFHIHKEGHAVINEDVEILLDFADKYLYGKEVARDFGTVDECLFENR